MTSEELLLTSLLESISELREDVKTLYQKVQTVSQHVVLTDQVLTRISDLEAKIAATRWLVSILFATLLVIAVADFGRIRSLLEYIQ